jgi:hypothetical protein
MLVRRIGFRQARRFSDEDARACAWRAIGRMDERDRRSERNSRGDENQCVRTGTKPAGTSGRSRVRRRRSGNARRVDGLLCRIAGTRPTRP